jgi:ketosteroid isomerase-like protein
VSENVDLVRSIVGEWQRGDYGNVEWADPGIEFVLAGGLDPSASRGVPAMGEAWGRWLREFEDFRTTAEEFRELDDQRVLVLTNNSGRGRRSGVRLGETSTPGATVFQIRDGKVTRLLAYPDRDEALADLGLS